jgi:mono/diheme cytochrome c family protein
MKRVVGIVQQAAVVLVVFFVVMLFANGRSSNSGPATTPAASSATPGERLYRAHCATCHGVDGQGFVGPQLAGRVTQRFPNEDDQIAVVTNGRGGMPAFGGQLSAAQIRAIVEYTRSGF